MLGRVIFPTGGASGGAEEVGQSRADAREPDPAGRGCTVWYRSAPCLECVFTWKEENAAREELQTKQKREALGWPDTAGALWQGGERAQDHAWGWRGSGEGSG